MAKRSGSPRSRTARGARASSRPPTCAPCSGSCAGSVTHRPTRTCSSASTPPTTPPSTGCATTSRSSSPPTSSPRSSTTRTTGVASPRPTRSPTCTRWAARRCSRSNLVAWPREGLPFELLARVLDGGGDVVRAAGALVGGGHSIDDAEPKFGLAVVGTVDPARVFTNRDARAGDVLVLTKPIGLGVISTALKRDAAPPELVADAIRVMTTLNAERARRGARTRRRRGARRDRRHRLRTPRPPARAARRVPGSRPTSTPARCR